MTVLSLLVVATGLLMTLASAYPLYALATRTPVVGLPPTLVRAVAAELVVGTIVGLSITLVGVVLLSAESHRQHTTKTMRPYR